MRKDDTTFSVHGLPVSGPNEIKKTVLKRITTMYAYLLL